MEELTLWTEDARPPWLLPCDHCELRTQSPHLTWGEGHPEAPVWVLLDNPGARVTSEGQPYVCGTRETLYRTTLRSGFLPNTLYLTFVIRRRPRRAYDKNSERQLCLPNLFGQLDTYTPKILVVLGDVALKSFTGNPFASIKERRQHWWCYGTIGVTSSYHPLAARRNPTVQASFEEDWHDIFEHYQGSCSG